MTPARAPVAPSSSSSMRRRPSTMPAVALLLAAAAALVLLPTAASAAAATTDNSTALANNITAAGNGTVPPFDLACAMRFSAVAYNSRTSTNFTAKCPFIGKRLDCVEKGSVITIDPTAFDSFPATVTNWLLIFNDHIAGKFFLTLRQDGSVAKALFYTPPYNFVVSSVQLYISNEPPRTPFLWNNTFLYNVMPVGTPPGATSAEIVSAQTDGVGRLSDVRLDMTRNIYVLAHSWVAFNQCKYLQYVEWLKSQNQTATNSTTNSTTPGGGSTNSTTPGGGSTNSTTPTNTTTPDSRCTADEQSYCNACAATATSRRIEAECVSCVHAALPMDRAWACHQYCAVPDVVGGPKEAAACAACVVNPSVANPWGCSNCMLRSFDQSSLTQCLQCVEFGKDGHSCGTCAAIVDTKARHQCFSCLNNGGNEWTCTHLAPASNSTSATPANGTVRCVGKEVSYCKKCDATSISDEIATECHLCVKDAIFSDRAWACHQYCAVPSVVTTVQTAAGCRDCVTASSVANPWDCSNCLMRSNGDAEAQDQCFACVKGGLGGSACGTCAAISDPLARHACFLCLTDGGNEWSCSHLPPPGSLPATASANTSALCSRDPEQSYCNACTASGASPGVVKGCISCIVPTLPLDRAWACSQYCAVPSLVATLEEALDCATCVASPTVTNPWGCSNCMLRASDKQGVKLCYTCIQAGLDGSSCGTCAAIKNEAKRSRCFACLHWGGTEWVCSHGGAM